MVRISCEEYSLATTDEANLEIKVVILPVTRIDSWLQGPLRRVLISPADVSTGVAEVIASPTQPGWKRIVRVGTVQVYSP